MIQILKTQFLKKSLAFENLWFRRALFIQTRNWILKYSLKCTILFGLIMYLKDLLNFNDMAAVSLPNNAQIK